MKRIVTLIIIITIITGIVKAEENITYYGLVDGNSVISSINFNDLKSKPQDYWAKSAIYQMAAFNVISGFSDKTFLPSNQLTNEQAVTLILKAIGKEQEVNSQTNVTDKDTWSDKYIRYAVNNGIITEKVVMKRSDIKASSNIDALKNVGVFIRDNVITREETAGMIARALNISGTKEMDFFDKTSIGDKYVGYVKAVTENAIMNGTEGKMFSPKGILRREEMAQILKNAEKFLLEKMNMFKGKALVDGISETALVITNESGEFITVEIGNRDVPVYKNGDIGGKNLLSMSDDIEYYFDASKQVKFINVISEGIGEQQTSSITNPKSVQGIVVGNSPYFRNITVKDKNGNSKVYEYGSWTRFYKDNKETSSSDVIQGDTVYIEFDEIGDVITVRAVSNYKIIYGTVYSINGSIYTIKFDDGKKEEYSLKNIPIYKDGQEIKYTDVEKGTYAKIFNYDSEIAKIEIVPDERQLEKIYKGEISDINLIQDKIILKNAEIYINGVWKRADVGFLSIPLDKEMKINFYGYEIEKEDFGENQVGKFAYIATRQDAKEVEKAKVISIDLKYTSEDHSDSVGKYYSSDKAIKLSDSSNKIYIDERSILIEDGKIVENMTFSNGDNVYVNASKIDGERIANIVEKGEDIEDYSDIELYIGTIYDIEENQEVTMRVNNKFIDDEWYEFSKRKLATFDITYDTRIISNSGLINVREFTIDDYEDKNIYLVANGQDIVEISLMDLGETPYIIRGTLSKIASDLITVSGVEYYDRDDEEWYNTSKQSVKIISETIIIENGKVIKQKDLETDKEVTIIKINDETINGAGAILIKN